MTLGAYYGEDDNDSGWAQESGRRFVQHPAVLAVLLAAILGLGYLVYQSDRLGSTSVDQAEKAAIDSELVAEPDPDAPAAEEETATAVDEAEDGADTATDEPAEEPDVSVLASSADIAAPDGPFVAVDVDIYQPAGGGMVVLSGRVPDAETAAAVETAANISYAPFVESTLEIDESLEPAPWLAQAPALIGLLPSITDGTIMVAEEKVLLSARSPNEQYLGVLQGGLEAISGMPVELVDAQITNLAPPLFNAEFNEGLLVFTGNVPSAEIPVLVGGAEQAYGAENVDNQLVADDETYSSFWMRTLPGLYQLLGVCPSYRFTVEDGQASGAIQGGVTFEADSSEIGAQAAAALDISVAILARDVSSGMLVVGHTDSSGSDVYNQTLSQSRAQSVVEYFIESGINGERLVARGAGESEPIASNETDEGKARNRRVEFQFGPAQSLLG